MTRIAGTCALGMAPRWAFWLAGLAAWTACLLTPYPVEVGDAVLPARATFPTAKALHVSAYAVLCGLSAWLHRRGRLRWLLPALLVLHGGGTEFLQQFVPRRSGCWSDVGLDCCGIGLGLALTWRRWRCGR